MHDKAFDFAKNPKYDGYQRELASMVFKEFLTKKTPGSGIKNIPNKQLAEELHKSIIRKINKRKKHSPFVDNILGTYLADMQLISNSIKDLDFYYVL